MQFPYADTRSAMVGMGLSPSVAAAFVEMAEGFNTGRITGEPRSAANTTPDHHGGVRRLGVQGGVRLVSGRR